MSVLDELTVLFEYRNDPLNAQRIAAGKRQLGGVEKKARLTGLAMGAITAGLGAAGYAMLRFGVESVKTFAEIQGKMSTIEGLVGISAQQLDAWNPIMHNIRRNTGRTFSELTSGLYDITSAGLRGDVAMEALEISAKASAAGMGETRVVADLLTSALNAWGPEALSAAQAGDDLAKAVELGKLPADALAGAMGSLIPIASEMGLEFGEMAGLMAAMSRTGTNAETAAVQLGQVLSLLIKPGKDARDTLAQFGFSAEELRERVADEGLLPVLQDLKTSFGDNEEAIAKVFPNIRALRGVFDLLGANLQTNVAIVDGMADSAGKLDEAFIKVTDDVEFAQAKFGASMEAMKAEIGELLAPGTFAGLEKLTGLLEGVTSAISEVSDSRATERWVEETNDAILAGARLEGPMLAFEDLDLAEQQSMIADIAAVAERPGVKAAPDELLTMAAMNRIAEREASGDLSQAEADARYAEVLSSARSPGHALQAVMGEPDEGLQGAADVLDDERLLQLLARPELEGVDADVVKRYVADARDRGAMTQMSMLNTLREQVPEDQRDAIQDAGPVSPGALQTRMGAIVHESQADAGTAYPEELESLTDRRGLRRFRRQLEPDDRDAFDRGEAVPVQGNVYRMVRDQRLEQMATVESPEHMLRAIADRIEDIGPRMAADLARPVVEQLPPDRAASLIDRLFEDHPLAQNILRENVGLPPAAEPMQEPAPAPQGAPEAAPGIAGPPEPVEADAGALGAETVNVEGVAEPVTVDADAEPVMVPGEAEPVTVEGVAEPVTVEPEQEERRGLFGAIGKVAEHVGKAAEHVARRVTGQWEAETDALDPSSVRKDVRAFRIDPSEYEEPAPPAPVEPELAPMEPIDLETQVPGMDVEPVTVDADAEPVAVEADAAPVLVDADAEPVTVDADAEPVSVDADAEPVTVVGEAEAVTVESDAAPVLIEADAEPVMVDADAEPVTVTGDAEPVAVDADAEPVTVEGQADPVTVTGDAEAVAVDADAEPVTVAGTAAPVLVDASADPVSVEADAEPVTVVGEAEPVTVEGQAEPVTVTGEAMPVTVDADAEPVTVASQYEDAEPQTVVADMGMEPSSPELQVPNMEPLDAVLAGPTPPPMLQAADGAGGTTVNGGDTHIENTFHISGATDPQRTGEVVRDILAEQLQAEARTADTGQVR